MPTLALDDSGLILDEYRKCLRAYPDSVGYMFLRKWLDSNWHNTNRAGGVYNCPPPVGSPRFARGTAHGFGSPCSQGEP